MDAPVLDDHIHLDPANGEGVEAVDEFARAGGTHLLVVNKPSWSVVGAVDDEAGFREVFDITVDIVAAATERLPGRAWPVLGVHPALVSRLISRGYEPDGARSLMAAGLDVAAEYVASGPALALKSGRPHYDVDAPVWEVSNQVMRHAFTLGAETGCGVQLHTEAGETFDEVAEWAEACGLARERVVKHYAGGQLSGPIPSVISRKDALLDVATAGTPFMMETDFLDDPDRPGAVLGPKTVPRRTRWLDEKGHAEAIRRAHVETPARVYGIDTLVSLDP